MEQSSEHDRTKQVRDALERFAATRGRNGIDGAVLADILDATTSRVVESWSVLREPLRAARTMLARRVRDYIRRHPHVSFVGGHQELEALTHKSAFNHAESEILFEQLARVMTDEDKSIIELLLLGFSWREIGKAKGMSPDAARMRIKRLRDLVDWRPR